MFIKVNWLVDGRGKGDFWEEPWWLVYDSISFVLSLSFFFFFYNIHSLILWVGVEGRVGGDH